MTIKKVLVANRGEIACRIISTCRRLGISTVAVYSDCDENAPFVKMADEAYHIGGSVASQSYLDGGKVIAAAQRSGADALHPGYGFLSENADFADQVEEANIQFIGPSPVSMRTIGDKSAAKDFIKAHVPGLPLIPGYNGADQSVQRLEQEAKHLGFPVLLKASAGGGGKGMRAVYEPERLRDEIEAAKGESLRAFGSDRLLIEKFFESVRHIEIQIFGDQHGNVYHIQERDCSIQRRHQKLVEETPSPAVDEPLRREMTSAAVQLGQKLRYEGAGTVEFVLDERSRSFYFLELNTRLQVEHPITEAVTGLDLVELQLLVAQGANLAQLGLLDCIPLSGHAIECRLCAEDADRDFAPRTGVIRKWSPASDLPGARFDTGVQDGSEITVYYDSMIAKVIVHASTRAEAIRRMATVLARTVVLGVTTNQKFLIQVMKNAQFQTGSFDTNFIALESSRLFEKDTQLMHSSVVAATMFDWAVRRSQQTQLRNTAPNWRNVQWRIPSTRFIANQETELEIHYHYKGEPTEKQHHFQCAVHVPGEKPPQSYQKHDLLLNAVLYEDTVFELPVLTKTGIQGASGLVRASIDASQRYFYIAEQVHDIHTRSFFVHDFAQGHQVELAKVDRLKSAATAADDDHLTPYTASMPCRILKILAPSGTVVKKNEPLLSIESMKTEVKIISRHDGTVTINVEENQLVDARALLCKVA